jgi:hypothetical protein
MFTYYCSLMPCYEYAHAIYMPFVIACMSGLDMIDEIDAEI